MGQIFGIGDRNNMRGLGWLNRLIGELSYRPPAWMRPALGRLAAWRSRHAAGLKRGLQLAVLALLLAGLGALVWQQLPKPAIWIATAEAPGLTPYPDDEAQPLRPQALEVSFEYQPASDAPSDLEPPASPAALELIGEKIDSGITLTPAMPGTWQWLDERLLQFQPDRDWPADTAYSIALDRSLLAGNARLPSTTLRMRTPKFEAMFGEMSFGADETDPSKRYATVRIDFSHPVDRNSLPAKLRLHWRAGSEGVGSGDIDYTLEFDPHARIAWLKTAPIELPPQDSYLVAELRDGVRAASGAALTSSAGEAQVLVPSARNAFRLTRADTAIVRDETETPFQTLILEFSEAVSARALAPLLEVYLLPRRDRNGHAVAEDDPNADRARSRWRDVGKLTPEALAMARRLDVRLTPGERETQAVQSLRFEAPDNRELYLRVRAGLTSASRLTLPKDLETVIRADNYPREARLIGSGAVLARSGERKLSFIARGLPALKVEIGRVDREALQHLVSQTYGDISSPRFHHWDFNEDNLVERSEKILRLAPGDDREPRYASLDLSQFLGERSLGLFFVRVTGWDERNRRETGEDDRRLVLLSDMGIVVKTNRENQTRELFVMDVAQGRPVGGAEVSLLGRNGVAIASRRTDALGHAHFEDVSGLHREREPTVFVVRRGADVAFMPYDRYERGLDYSRFDIGGEDSFWRNDQGLSAYAFSDRGIYRPGETVHLAYIVKRRDFKPTPRLPLEIQVSDPRGQTLFERRVSLDEYGFDALDIPTQAHSPTGSYQVQVRLVQGRNGERRQVIGHAEFKVEEFQPDRLKIRPSIAGSEGKAWLAPGELQLDVVLENLFGAPAEARKVTATAVVQPAQLNFESYRGYRFIDPLRDENMMRSESIPLPDGLTNEQGEAQFKLDLARYAQGIYRVTATVQGFEQAGGRGVAGASTVMLSPLDALVGWKADGDLSYLRRDAQARLHLVAIGADGQPRALPALRARLMERVRQSSLVRGNDGRFRYQSLEQLKPVGEAKPAALGAEGLSYALDTARPGNFVIEFLDGTGLVRARTDYFVAGEGDLSASLERSAELKLALDARDYAPGDEIELALTAPFHGAGLITIETNKVVAWKWFQATSNASVQHITVPEGIDGSAYVNVAFVRALDSPEIYTSPLSYAVAPISVGRARRTLDLTLEAPDTLQPGKTLEIRYASPKKARMAVYAVDEGILQVARYRTPTPLDHFLRKRALEVDTMQTVDLLLPEFRLLQQIAGVGGGEAALAALLKNLNPFARKSDAPAVYWLGLVDAGPEARTARYVVPDHFNGRLRLMAVAVGDEAIGVAERAVTVRAPIVITPNLLTVAAPGDEFEVVAGLNNGVAGSGGQAQITLSLEPSAHLEIVGAATQTLNVPENREASARFRVRALPAFGNATLRFRARLGDVEQSRSATLSVRPPVAYAGSVALGRLDSGTHRVELPRKLLPVQAEARLGLSQSPLLLADGLVQYLSDYPYSCTEQLVSAAFPSLVVGGDERIAALVSALRIRQQDNGGFSLWPGGGSSDADASLHALHFLRDALEAQKLPADAQVLLERGRSFLMDIARRPATQLPAARRRAYAIYLLTRGGEVTGNHVLDLQQWLKDQPEPVQRGDALPLWLAATQALLQNEPEAQRLIGGYRLGRKAVQSPGPYDSVLAQDAQYVYVLARHFPQRLGRLGERELDFLVAPLLNQGYNSYSAAFTVLALNAYGEAVDAAPPEAFALAADGKASELSLDADGKAALSPDTRAVRVVAPSGSYYALMQKGFDAQAPQKAQSQGIEITREFLDAAGQPIRQFRVGDNVRVRLRLRSTDGARHANVALVDLLPGGFEVDLDSLSGWRRDHLDVREDRVVWFGPVDGQLSSLSYTARVTAAGTFVVPPARAGSMYREDVWGTTAVGTVSVLGSGGD